MKLLKRGAVVAAMAAASVALTASSAGASITTDPYTSTADTGSFVTDTALGTSACDVSGITGTLNGTSEGASGTITGQTIENCEGVIQTATSLTTSRNPISIILELDASNNQVAIARNVQVLVTTAFGACLYSGDLSGTWTSGTDTITVTNPAFPLTTRLSGIICSTSADVTLTVGPIGARINNP